jgi:hypothetical protein
VFDLLLSCQVINRPEVAIVVGMGGILLILHADRTISPSINRTITPRINSHTTQATFMATNTNLQLIHSTTGPDMRASQPNPRPSIHRCIHPSNNSTTNLDIRGMRDSTFSQCLILMATTYTLNSHSIISNSRMLTQWAFRVHTLEAVKETPRESTTLTLVRCSSSPVILRILQVTSLVIRLLSLRPTVSTIACRSST